MVLFSRKCSLAGPLFIFFFTRRLDEVVLSVCQRVLVALKTCANLGWVWCLVAHSALEKELKCPLK